MITLIIGLHDKSIQENRPVEELRQFIKSWVLSNKEFIDGASIKAEQVGYYFYQDGSLAEEPSFEIVFFKSEKVDSLKFRKEIENLRISLMDRFNQEEVILL